MGILVRVRVLQRRSWPLPPIPTPHTQTDTKDKTTVKTLTASALTGHPIGHGCMYGCAAIWHGVCLTDVLGLDDVTDGQVHEALEHLVAQTGLLVQA